MPGPQELFGPMLVGVFLNTILYGVLIVQTFIYFQTYRKDRLWLKYFVSYLFIVETLNTGFDIGMMYEPLVVRYGTTEAVTFFPLMLAADPILTVAISMPVQIFVAWRIKIISRSKWIPLIICLTALLAFAGGMWTAVVLVIVRRYSRKPETNRSAIVWLIPSAVSNALITTSLIRSLFYRKSGIKANFVNGIIRLTIQTGVITAIAAWFDVIFFLVSPSTTLNLVWDFALSKLYTNSLISTLNSRIGHDNLAGTPAHNVLFGDIPGEIYTSASFRFAPAITTTMTGAIELEDLAQGKRDRDTSYSETVTSRIVFQRNDSVPPIS